MSFNLILVYKAFEVLKISWYLYLYFYKYILYLYLNKIVKDMVDGVEQPYWNSWQNFTEKKEFIEFIIAYQGTFGKRNGHLSTGYNQKKKPTMQAK